MPLAARLPSLVRERRPWSLQRLPDLRPHLGPSALLGSAAAIALSTGLTGLLGIIFWVVAARQYTPEVVGQASAVVSGLLAVSGFAQLEMYGVLTKFLPTAGPRARGLVLRCYAGAVVIGAFLAVGAVLLAPLVSPDLRVLRTPAFGAVFIVAVAVWGVFALQDAVLVGVRRAHVTVPENVLFSLAKLGLLVLALDASALYVLASYALPAALCLIPVNVLIFRRYLPQAPRTASALTARAVLQYARWDVVASWTGTATVAGVPLIVIAAEGAAATGIFYAAWSMVTALDLLALAVGTSLVVQSGYVPSRLRSDARLAFGGALAVTLPLVALVLLAAPAILGLFGTAYAASGEGLLRVLALASLPRALVLIASAADRGAGRPEWAAANSAIVAAAALAGVVLGSSGTGLLPIGLGWLFGNLVAALVVLPLWWRRHRGSAPQEGREPVAPHAEAAARQRSSRT